MQKPLIKLSTLSLRSYAGGNKTRKNFFSVDLIGGVD